MTKIAFVYAEDEAGWIGVNQKLPWHIAEDLKHFKQVTMGHPVIMGRKTFDSIGRPLPKRTNVVISRSSKPLDSVVLVHSVPELLGWMKQADEAEPYMVIGGAQIFRALIPYVNVLYRTVVAGDHHGDTKMPAIDLTNWTLVNKKAGSKNDSANAYWFEKWVLNEEQDGEVHQ